MNRPGVLARRAGSALFFVSFVAVGIQGCDSTNMWHLFHLTTQPEDLYDPIATDRYFLNEPSALRTYTLRPRYDDFYELGLRSAAEDIPLDYRFSGRVRAEFLVGDEVVKTQEITSVISAVYATGDSKHYKKVALATFVLPLASGAETAGRLRLTVLEPDVIDTSLGASLELYVAVTSTP